MKQHKKQTVKPKVNKIDDMIIKSIHREKINPAPYNPRNISDEAKRRLKKSIDNWGLVEPLVWNKRSGNLVSGHQRLSILDEKGLDYDVQVSVIDFPENKEMALNIALNNQNMAGEWDYPKLKDIFAEIDTGDLDMELTGFSEDELKGMFDYDVNTEGQLIEKSEELKPYNKTHILLSFSPDKLIDIQPYLEKICNIEGIEYEQSSN